MRPPQRLGSAQHAVARQRLGQPLPIVRAGQMIGRARHTERLKDRLSLVTIQRLARDNFNNAPQHVRGVSVALSGGVLTAATITWFAGSWLQGSHRIKLSREQILVIGVLMTTLGIALIPIAVFVPNSIGVAALLASFVWGVSAFGMGICFPTLGVLLLDKSAEEEHARNSAALQMSDSFGVIIATAIAGSLLSLASLKSEITSNTFTSIWIFCAIVGLMSILFIPRTQVKVTS